MNRFAGPPGPAPSRLPALALVLGLIGLLLVTTAQAADPPSSSKSVKQEQEKFFEEQVRPLLVANCHECHGAKKQESGFRLDSRKAAIEGGDSGERAVVPGDPDRSLLIKAIKHVGDYHMPPSRKLPEEQVAILTEWIKQGAPWPQKTEISSQTVSSAERVLEHRRTHWAYQRPVWPALAAVNDRAWLRGRLDAFVLAKLEASRLVASGEADRRTLIRRISYDLHGLPPSVEEVEAFLADESPDGYERLVDRLLASPRYGERWGRHWLDIARYADTKGYAFAQERRYPYAYTYRDWVIGALNRELPYDEFILQQLAADRLVSKSVEPLDRPERSAYMGDVSSLAALGFLTTGRRFNNRHDDIDDQIDAVSRGMLGMTVSCARCHDHKYDAIPTEDYYSLYGVFANCSEPSELPLLGSPEAGEKSRQGEEYRKFEEQLAKLKTDFSKFSADKHAEFLGQARRQSADYLARIAAGETNTLLAKLPFMSLDPKDLRPRLLERWRRYLDEHAQADHPVLGLWHDLLVLPTEGIGEKAAPILARWLSLATGTGRGECNPLVQAAFAADVVVTRMDVARIYGKLLTDAYETAQAASTEAPAHMPDEVRQIADILLGKDSPTDIPIADVRQYLNRSDRNKHSELQKKVESHQANSQFAPPRAMVVADNAQPADARVLIRGNPARPGSPVPRQFLLVLAGEERQPFAEGSGRLELARAIVNPHNPLTRRVIANRLWMHHFGEPLVLTPSDFGVRAERPTHPELLDELAMRLLDAGWSLKALHREMVGSATYRQASNDRPDCRAVDPENRLLWRMNRRRLELEAMRDSLLEIAGQLDTRMYGRPIELTKSPFPRRRAIYGFIDRQDLPGMFRVFDIASPDQSSPRRPRTTVPQQALFLMNSPFIVEQARALAARPEVAAAGDDDAKISALYRLIFCRAPDSEETEIGRQFIADSTFANADSTKLAPWEQYAQLLLLSNEVMYVD